MTPVTPGLLTVTRAPPLPDETYTNNYWAWFLDTGSSPRRLFQSSYVGGGHVSDHIVRSSSAYNGIKPVHLARCGFIQNRGDGASMPAGSIVFAHNPTSSEGLTRIRGVGSLDFGYIAPDPPYTMIVGAPIWDRALEGEQQWMHWVEVQLGASLVSGGNRVRLMRGTTSLTSVTEVSQFDSVVEDDGALAGEFAWLVWPWRHGGNVYVLLLEGDPSHVVFYAFPVDGSAPSQVVDPAMTARNRVVPLYVPEDGRSYGGPCGTSAAPVSGTAEYVNRYPDGIGVLSEHWPRIDGAIDTDWRMIISSPGSGAVHGSISALGGQMAFAQVIGVGSVTAILSDNDTDLTYYKRDNRLAPWGSTPQVALTLGAHPTLGGGFQRPQAFAMKD